MTNDFILRYSTIEKLDIIFWKKKCTTEKRPRAQLNVNDYQRKKKTI